MCVLALLIGRATVFFRVREEEKRGGGKVETGRREGRGGYGSDELYERRIIFKRRCSLI